MKKFLAHVTMRPLDGEDPFVVETEFESSSYLTAFDHVTNLGQRFQAKVVAHKLQELQSGITSEVLYLPPPYSATKEREAKPTLTVNVPSWVAAWTPSMPTPYSYPQAGGET